MIAKTLFGFEDLLVKELEDLGAKDVVKLNRAVAFSGNKRTMYMANYHLRTAIKILKPIDQFKVRNEDDLYRNIQKIDWEDYLDNDKTFAINATIHSDFFNHSKYVALKSKDAIVDQFRDRTGIRPSIDTEDPDLRLSIHIADTLCTVSLDSTGLSMGKRGYKTKQVFAPLSEVLGAGLVLLSDWDQKTDFIDPMCGSGTIPIEAALIAYNIAPGKFRHFTFQYWEDFDDELFDKIKREAKEKEKTEGPKIYCWDKDRKAIEITGENAVRAGVRDYIKVTKQNFLNTPEYEGTAHIVINPPYGERLDEDDDMNELYGELGTHLKHKYNGSDAWIISGNLRAVKFVGLRTSKKIKLFNGPLECRFNKFELYRGSKKGKKNPEIGDQKPEGEKT